MSNKPAPPPPPVPPAPYVEYTVFAIDDGRVIRTGSARQDQLSSQAPHPGEIILEGKFDHRTTKLIDGQPTSVEAPDTIVTPEMVRTVAMRKLKGTDWHDARSRDTGKAIPKAIKDERKHIWDRYDAISAMSPIPVDFTADKYWQ